MAKEITIPPVHGDLLMLRVARMIAQDMIELPEVLKQCHVSPEQWQRMEREPRFQKYLQECILNWNAAENAPERVKIKAAAAIEEWLPEGFSQMHNQDAPLLHRNDLAKLMAKLGGMDNGTRLNGEQVVGDRFQVTINLGADAKLTIDKELPPKVIDGEVIDAA